MAFSVSIYHPYICIVLCISHAYAQFYAQNMINQVLLVHEVVRIFNDRGFTDSGAYNKVQTGEM